MALAAICRETVASDGPTAALLAACGPVFVLTSPTVVTTLATACEARVLWVGTLPRSLATTGESAAALPVVVARRTSG
jgi:hypothetical protein